MIEGSGSVPLTNGPIFGRPKNRRIRRITIRNTGLNCDAFTDTENFGTGSPDPKMYPDLVRKHTVVPKNREHSLQRRTIMDLTLSLVNFPNIMHFWRWLGNLKNTYSFSASAFHKNHTICKFCGSALASIQVRIRSGSETLSPCVHLRWPVCPECELCPRVLPPSHPPVHWRFCCCCWWHKLFPDFWISAPGMGKNQLIKAKSNYR